MLEHSDNQIEISDALKKDMKIGLIKADAFGVLNKETLPKYVSLSESLLKDRIEKKKRGIVTIRILDTKNNLSIKGGDKNVATTHRTTVEYGKNLGLLSNLTLGKSVPNIKSIELLHNGKKVILPRNDLKNLLEFLFSGFESSQDDCYRFIQKIKGMQVDNRKDITEDVEKKRIFKHEKYLSVGDCIGLIASEANVNGSLQSKDLKHFAYYLGNGMFLSRYDVGGKLVVSTLDEMNKFYKTGEYVKMSPLAQ